MCFNTNAASKFIFVGTLAMFSVAANSATVDVTVHNNTPKFVNWSSSAYTQLPTILAPGAIVTIKILTPVGSSDIRARYASGQVSGGCEFQAGHTEYPTGPKYTSSANGYGQVSGFCSVFLTKKWTAPYNYQVKFVISQ
jgi:hypothetical protein